jgi:hypothetical protein
MTYYDNLYAGQRTDPSGTISLAQYLEDAFDEVRTSEYGLDPLSTDPAARDERMMLFLGIAQGLVNWLADHPAAFVIDDHGDSQAWEHDIHKTGHVRIRIDGRLHP